MVYLAAVEPAHTPASVLTGGRATRRAAGRLSCPAVRLSWLLATGVLRIAAPSHSALPRALASSSSRGRPLGVYVTTGERPPGICQWHRTVSGGDEGTKLSPKGQYKNSVNCNKVSLTPDIIPTKPVHLNVHSGPTGLVCTFGL